MSKPEQTFEEWMEAVDERLVQAFGLSSQDLPDVCYYDWYEAGDTPSQAVKQAIRYARGD